ncbi:hypothetical protein BP00DRAFT_36006 [Aspergillus indologenus CBS 114.80]|uniref:Uncharacterized protein n=1 Tax=Aspergillus indologenus CBS 114.80 TaxID=1450541 RepID=A0A2V5J1G4_9EURO|nr:hypothetical protein BP00DRAFT_36006 [Aspergillus indologenus CBS 114.80]
MGFGTGIALMECVFLGLGCELVSLVDSGSEQDVESVLYCIYIQSGGVVLLLSTWLRYPLFYLHCNCTTVEHTLTRFSPGR